MTPDDLDAISKKPVAEPETPEAQWAPLSEELPTWFTDSDRDALVAALREAWAERDEARRLMVIDFDRADTLAARRLAAPVEPVEEADAYAVRAEKAEAALDKANTLLRYALHLRINGERAPGGNETWRQFDRDCDEHLRSVEEGKA